jgi:type 1 glutamine amidotransferase
MTDRTLAPYDAVMLNYSGPRWGEAAEKALENFVRSGRGLVVVNSGSWPFHGFPLLEDDHSMTDVTEPPWDEFPRMLGGRWAQEAPATCHAPRHSYTVTITDKEHPITKGLGDSFKTNDELYHNMRMLPEAHVLATAWDDPNNTWPENARNNPVARTWESWIIDPDFGKPTGNHEPTLWTVAYGRGRVFHTTLGLDVEAMQYAGFQATLLRGTEWACSGRVTLTSTDLSSS